MKMDFLSFLAAGPDFSWQILQRAEELKKTPRSAQLRHSGKSLLMFFEKHSTRTRLSFAAAAHQLGAQTIFLTPQNSQTARGESVEDTAQMFGLFANAVAVRTSAHERLELIARHCSAPVINALTDLYHPCQVLADTLTLRELFGDTRSLRVAYIGDGNNMAHSLAAGASIFGYELAIATPAGYEPDAAVLAQCRTAGAHVTVSNDPHEAARDSHAVYTDVWISMGQEAEQEERRRAFVPYMVDRVVMAMAESEAIFLHCLPAHRGEEVEAEVIDGAQSRVMLQAENRLHAQKGLLDLLFE